MFRSKAEVPVEEVVSQIVTAQMDGRLAAMLEAEREAMSTALNDFRSDVASLRTALGIIPAWIQQAAMFPSTYEAVWLRFASDYGHN